MSVGMHVKSQLTERRWENAEFPIVCEGCLGDNPYVRMSVDRFGGSCKMCEKPYTVFRWRPGRGEGYRKTEVCQGCARTKNLCQTCLLDMQLGLPSQLRDAVLQHVDGALAVPVSDVNRAYVQQQQLALLDEEDSGMLGEAANERLLQIARDIHMNRAQPRVKVFQPSKPSAAPVTGEEGDAHAGSKRSASDAELDSTGLPLPPGINSLEQLSSVMNLDRLPPAMREFLAKQYGQVVEPEKPILPEKTQEAPQSEVRKDTNEGAAATQTKEEKPAAVKKAPKMKHTPKPPAGPPPPSVLKSDSTA